MKGYGWVLAAAAAVVAVVVVGQLGRKPATVTGPVQGPPVAAPQSGTAGLVAGLGALGAGVLSLGQGQGWW